MPKKEVIIRTPYRREYFEIEALGNELIVSRLSSVFLSNRKVIKLGQAKTMEGALDIARDAVQGEILEIKIKDQ